MSGIRLFQKLTVLTMGRLCQRLKLLAGLALLCFLLAWGAGAAAESALSQGTAFSGITLAITAPEGDRVPELLEQYLGGMADVRQYCQLRAMPHEQAIDALESGEVTAVLVLPEHFIRDISWGENSDVRVLVDRRRPLEAMLTLWVGQSASDFLAAFQAGVYRVIELYDARPAAGLSRDRMIGEINLVYLQWTVNREGMFRTLRLLPTDALPIALHYRLSLFWFLILSLAPMFSDCFQGGWPQSHRRLAYAGRSSLYGLFSSLTACALLIAPVVLAALTLWLRLPLPEALGLSCLCALFFAGYSGLCGLLTNSAAACGSLSFLLDALFTLCAGGLIPPVLLPQSVGRLGAASPIAWMRGLTAGALGYPAAGAALPALAGTAAGLSLLCALLYRRRVTGKGDAP